MTFDFPGSVRLVANACDPATATLRARFARFETAKDGAAPSVGVVVEPLLTEDIEGDSAWWTHSPYGMGFGFHRGRRAVIFPRRGESVSWLPDAWPPRLSRGTGSLARGIRRRAAALAVRMLPSRLVPPVARRLDPVHPVEARELFPESQVSPPVAPAAVALLSGRTQGRELSCEPLGAPEALDELAAIQELVFHELAPLDRLVRLCDPGTRVDPRGVLERDLAGCRFVRLSVGRDAGVEGAPRMLAERLESIGEGT
ncbi:MAG: hypothetical protein HY720_14285 [Planctomycetes bacterium]|nr:hypothetical protein [Planctomycetota bacterium]